MATLTEAQLNHIWAMSGDDCLPHEVNAERVQYLYDTFGSATPLCMSMDPLGSTIVWVLRQRVRKAAKLVNKSNDAGSTSYSQKYDHLKEQLKEAELECGYGPIVTVSTFSLGLDATCEDDSAWYAEYARCGWWGVLA